MAVNTHFAALVLAEPVRSAANPIVSVNDGQPNAFIPRPWVPPVNTPPHYPHLAASNSSRDSGPITTGHQPAVANLWIRV